MAKDRREYYKEYNKKHGDRHKKGYYRKYNQAHPERLNRGFTKGYVNGNVSDGPKQKERQWLNETLGIYIIGYDEMMIGVRMLISLARNLQLIRKKRKDYDYD